NGYAGKIAYNICVTYVINNTTYEVVGIIGQRGTCGTVGMGGTDGNGNNRASSGSKIHCVDGCVSVASSRETHCNCGQVINNVGNNCTLTFTYINNNYHIVQCNAHGDSVERHYRANNIVKPNDDSTHKCTCVCGHTYTEAHTWTTNTTTGVNTCSVCGYKKKGSGVVIQSFQEPRQGSVLSLSEELNHMCEGQYCHDEETYCTITS
ncbi:MAG: hypothetical protein RRY18_02230, partial [Clostridia bacterium]